MEKNLINDHTTFSNRRTLNKIDSTSNKVKSTLNNRLSIYNWNVYTSESSYSVKSGSLSMDPNADVENANVGRGVGLEWMEKQRFETEDEMKAYCAENLLSRGRTNHNIGKRVTYLTCNHQGCIAKLRLIKKLDADIYILEAVEGFDHQHNDVEIAPERGLSEEQKRITLECNARDSGAPKKVSSEMKTYFRI